MENKEYKELREEENYARIMEEANTYDDEVKQDEN